MRMFFDTSAFAKRYVQEQGSQSVLQLCGQAHEIGLSAIVLPELISAFCRLRREEKITGTQYQQLKSLLLADIADAAVCDLTPVVLARAVACLESNTLRGMDAIHIGSALALNADVFVSADNRQLEAAARAGLVVQQV